MHKKVFPNDGRTNDERDENKREKKIEEPLLSASIGINGDYGPENRGVHFVGSQQGR